MAAFKVVADWTARSEALRLRWASLSAQRSFWLWTAPLPLKAGTLASKDAAQWDTVAPAALVINAASQGGSATFEVPDGADLVRLDFDLSVAVGGVSASCLEFRQLFAVDQGGTLLPRSYSMESVAYVASPGGPVRTPAAGKAARRTILGTCPLIGVTTGKVTINCEFIDVTELWWGVWAKLDRWRWYLDPDIGGRQDLLRVLAWTSGTAPMIWFVAPSDRATTGKTASGSEGEGVVDATSDPPAAPLPAVRTPVDARPGADVVFFRAPAGLNSFFYTADAKGFLGDSSGGGTTSGPLADSHAGKTMFNLGRWLLSTRTNSALAAKQAKAGSGALPTGLGLLGMSFVPQTPAAVPGKPPPAIAPADPVDLVQLDLMWAFRPANLEAALGASTAPDIAVLPLGFDGFGKMEKGGPGEKDKVVPGPWTAGGYQTIAAKDALEPTIASLRRLLWVRGALARDQTATPSFDRQLWIYGHSAANSTAFTCLGNNAKSIDRIISSDATPASSQLLASGVANLTAAAAVRKKLGKTCSAVVVSTSNMWRTMADYKKIQAALNGTGADVTMLPLDAELPAYWNHPPTQSSNPLLFEVLRAWDGKGLAASKWGGTMTLPPGSRDFRWLLWHEWAVTGGHLRVDKSQAPVRIRSFIEDALKLP